ncbi:SDR family oxidoreductase [Verrucomicrobiaceae bacterium 5K15]|uniref:SDR family oxidoreductase n=1 Tax=Oceaniferula flava TaxID=2800421 RepID=A0AAE2SGG4_9BACT|nr:SDR family oxidoreductase [Oceaniferula flavus]MBK1856427.1 SDR family oxidoreductase [Oceaniferula flavus]MBM1137734.1 SDR family oxidoreductase [Oceaniferula flavus]
MKTTLIIGGNSGIGEKLAQQLQRDGHQVLTASRQPSNFDHQVYDATSADSLELPEKLDGLVYCPGSITLKPFHRLSQEEMMNEWKLNALGAAHSVQQALPSLKQAEHASVVMFSTVAVQTGLPFHASIAMAKGAVEGLTRALAAELSPAIRVNAIAPSLTDTQLAEPLLNSDQKRQASAERHPLKRVGMPSEIASLAAWLLSDDARFMTGQILHADGGMSSVRTF